MCFVIMDILRIAMPENYFTLNSEVYLVKGAKRGALYDLNSGDIYSIDPFSVTFIENLQKGTSIMEAQRNISRIDLSEFYPYLEKLIQTH